MTDDIKTWLYNRTDIELLQCLIYGEARGEDIEGQVAVAWVVRNRVLSPVTWWGTTWKSVMLKQKQFSCFNDNDPNLDEIFAKWEYRRHTQAWRLARWVAAGVIYDTRDVKDKLIAWLPDVSGGANHYHATSVKPSWADDSKITTAIGSHIFYCL